MTSPSDETTVRPPGEDVTDDPIIIERHDELLTGEDRAAPEGPAGEGEARPAGDEMARGELAGDEPASDELVGRHAAPDTGGMEPPPLVVPSEPATAEPGAPAMGSGHPTAYDPASSGPAVMPEHAAPGSAVPDAGAPGSSSYAMSASGPAAADPAAAPATPAAVAEPGDPAVAGIPDAVSPGAEGMGGRSPGAGSTGAGIPAAALSEQQWPAIQALFVDDPRGSVQRAAAAADEVVKAFVASLEREQAALRTAWEDDPSTEDLRTALQQYRAFCGRLEGLA